MSETNAQEPTMEEILASIRKIISEDEPAAEAPAATVAVAEAPPPPAHPSSKGEPPVAATPAPTPPAPPPVEAEEDDVLELTEPLAAAPPPPHDTGSFHETLGDLDVFSSSTLDSSGFTPQAPSFPSEPLVGSYASEASAGHFGALARSVSMPKEGRSLEDVVRELLKPMLREWLDQYLPAIVEARVQAEVERIARRNEY